MSAAVTLHCDRAKCMATFTGGVFASEAFIRKAAQAQQGWTSRTAHGANQSYTYDYCKEHSHV